MENSPFTFTLACAQTLAFGTPSISFPDGSQSDFPLLSTDWETYKTLACVRMYFWVLAKGSSD